MDSERQRSSKLVCPLPQLWDWLCALSDQIQTSLVHKDPIPALARGFSHHTQLLEIR